MVKKHEFNAISCTKISPVYTLAMVPQRRVNIAPGLHVVADYVHNELGEAADKGIQAAVNRKCNEYYERMLSLAVSVQIEHPYAPVSPGDAVRFRRGSADFVGIVHAMQTELSEGLMTKTSIDVIGGALGEIYP